MRLDRFQNRGFERGRSRLTEALWLLLQGLLVDSWIPGSMHRIAILRLFGAKIGRGVVIKPHVRVKFPWRLEIGDYSWIGEGVWIDNLAGVTIGSHCCISQGAYLCTGSHDWSLETFDLITRPIVLEDHVWLCARCAVGPGVRARQGAVLTLGSTAVSELASWQIHSGIPAAPIRSRLESPGEAQRTAGNPGRMGRG
jgi:putative colanic acid biosynthesis acetyltransferase WcaF